MHECKKHEHTLPLKKQIPAEHHKSNFTADTYMLISACHFKHGVLLCSGWKIHAILFSIIFSLMGFSKHFASLTEEEFCRKLHGRTFQSFAFK